MRRFTLLLTLLCATAARAATYNATSCAQTGTGSIGALIAGAVDGDTVNGPVGGGSATWTGAVTSTATLLLINGNGCNITVAGTDILDLTWTNTSITPRITNFTLNGYAGAALFSLNGNIPQFRVDHITINAIPHSGNPYFIWFNHSAAFHYYNDMFGLVDHITYNCTQDGTCDAFLFYGRDWNWLNPQNMGSISAIYIEDSSFTCSACTGQHFGTVTDAQHGAKFVVRHSTFQNMSISEHDVGVGLDRGTRQFEVYNNTFTCVGNASASCFDAIALRGGTNLVYNNVLQMDAANGFSGWGVVTFSEIFRLADPGSGQIPWNGIIVSNPNHIFQPGNNPNGCFSQVPTGACAGASTGGVSSDFFPHNNFSPFAYCTAQSASCLSNPPLGSNVGAAIYTTFPDYTGPAVNNTLLTQIDGLASSPNGYPARDQTAAGPDTGVNHVQTGGAEPVYIWNNTCAAGSASCTTGALLLNAYNNGVNIGNFITLNKDVYEDVRPFTGASGTGTGTLAQRPASCTPVVAYWATDTGTLYKCLTTNTWTIGYQPLVYPHPLQGGTPVPPPPGGLTANITGSNVALTWNAVSGATSYNVYRGTINGGPYSKIATVTAPTTTYTDTPGNGTWYYTVTAVNSAGESIKSTQVSATLPANLVLTAAPASLVFPTTNVGSTSAPQLVTVTNSSTGGSPINITNVTIGGTNAADFMLASLPGVVQHTVQSLNNCTSGATCSKAFTNPVTAGNYVIAMGDDVSGINRSITFTDSGGNSYTQVSIGGHVYCNLATDGDSLGMSYAKIGASGPLTVTMADGGQVSGKALLIIEASNLQAASVLDQVSGCADTINVSTQSTAPVTTTWPYELLVPFYSNDGGGTAGNSWTAGTGFTLLDTGVTGSGLRARDADEYRVVSTTGSYASSIALSGIPVEIAGFMATFKGTGGNINTCTGASLAVGASCQFQTAFAPTGSGARSATATVNGTVSVNVPLSGNGASGVPTVSLTPAAITFGPQLVSTSSTSVPVILLNTGTGTLTISSIIMASGVNFSQSNSCGATLVSGASCTINVTFTPTVSGALSDTVQVNDNAAGTPHTVGLTGTGITTRAMLSKTAQLSGAVILH